MNRINTKETLCERTQISKPYERNLLTKYIHNIRNLRPLNKDMINNINYMTNDEKMDIILTFNDVVEQLTEIIEYLNKW